MTSSQTDAVPIAVIGGSSAFLPSLAAALADQAADMPPLELRLVGRDRDRTSAVGRFCRLHAEHRGAPHSYVIADDVEAAARGASIVLNQVRIGGFSGRSQDEQLALSFGYPGDETIGPSGLAAAIRATAPVLDIARTVEKVAPDAWFLQISNPMSMLLSNLIANTGLRTFGLCELPDRTLTEALELIGRNSQPVTSQYVGLNHQGWFVRVEAGGEDLLPEIFEHVLELDDGGFFGVDAQVMRAQGGLPLPYLKLLLHRERTVEKMLARPHDRGEQLAALAEALYAHYASTGDPALPARLQEREMLWNAMTVVPVLAALLGGPEVMAYVSEPNRGHLSFLGPDAIVEKHATITADGVGTVSPCQLDIEVSHPHIAESLRGISEFEQLGATAALRRDPTLAVEALQAHPFAIPSAEAHEMVGMMLATEDVGTGRLIS
ncbi:MAG: hypothetical protein VX951_12705 [Planctomycetota bacterium]|nr:hypothetical protein [Planctomycetota bacterium]